MDKENQQLLLSDFDYYLPKELIAQTPLLKRDESKLLIVDKENKTLTDKKFYDIIDIFGRHILLNSIQCIDMVETEITQTINEYNTTQYYEGTPEVRTAYCCSYNYATPIS